MMFNILCVDDTSANLMVLEALFEAHEDKYNIITAISGHDALGILLSTKIDLILLDVMMPELDGFETAQLVKSNKKTKNIPIIFLTAKKDDETIHNSFKYGVDYLSKPYGEFELFTRVDMQLKLVKSQANLQEQIKFNQSILDAQNTIVFIYDANGIFGVNKKFLEFFNVTDLEEFKKDHKCVSRLFMKFDNYFSLDIIEKDDNWCEILSVNQKDNNVLLMDVSVFEPKAFKIDINQIDDTNKYVVVLTDITNLTTKSNKFETKATYDELTKIYNRGKFNEMLTEHYNLFKRYDEPLSFAIFDIDFFKLVNDTYGHVVGDETLITFAKTIDEAVRTTDIFARWGGEEFTLLLPETKAEDAFEVADKLRILIENIPFKTIGQKTCSIGVTQFKKDDTIDSVLTRADEALYEAKESGRNKVCIK